MATTTSPSPSTSIDPRPTSRPAQSPTMPVNNHISSVVADLNSISPYYFYQPYSVTGSPSNLASPSDNGASSDIGDYYALDEYSGVNFDIAAIPNFDTSLAAIQDIHISEKATHTESYLSETVMADLELIDGLAAPTQPAVSSTTHTASPFNSSQSHGSGVQMTVSHSQPLTSHHTARLTTMTPLAIPFTTPKLRLTPVESSRNTDDAVSPGHPAQVGHSPRFTITPWGSSEEHDLPAESDVEDDEDAGNYPEMNFETHDDSLTVKNENGEASTVTLSQVPSFQYRGVGLDSDIPSGRRGLEPERRRSISGLEIPNFKDQAKADELQERIRQVEEWRSRAENASSTAWTWGQPRTALGATDHWNRRRAKSTGASISNDVALDFTYPTFPPTPQQSNDPEEGKGIEPVSDAASIRENRIQEGQTYINAKAREIIPRDLDLLAQPRHFNDPPTFVKTLRRQNQPDTANAAIAKYNEAADTYSLLSRQATWGTRRRSEPSLSDIESISNGSFIKRLSFGREKREKKPGIFKEFANNIVRKKSDAGSSSKLKRSRPEVPISHARRESQSSLAPPRVNEDSNRSRPESPRLDTSVGPQPGLLRRARSGSGSPSPSSPSGSKNNFVSNVIRRARSRSDFSRRPESEGLVGLWRSSGGPPVPTLASPLVDSDEAKTLEDNEIEVEEDDDDEPGDDGDRMEFDPASPVAPTFMGFRQHALTLNPNMEQSYLVDRIAHQQVVRYKALLNSRVKHSVAVNEGSCAAGNDCISLGGAASLLDPKGHPLNDSASNNGFQVLADISDGDANPEGQLGESSFPPGVPLPPVAKLPAKFECQLCFKVKEIRKPSDWTKHIHEDVQPFTCTYSNCREPKSFKRKADWVRHENERHRHLEWWACQVDDCRHKCYRKDNFLQHLVREHKLPEPKNKTKAAVKTASGEDEEVWARVRACHHESSARPQDEPCKFCGKCLNSWRKLTVHLAKHMEHISLRVLGLIEQQCVNADTIISPVDPLPPRSAPFTPVTMGRELSASSGLWTSSTGISPAIPSGSQFLAAGPYRTSPNNRNLSQFGEPIYSSSEVYNGVSSAQAFEYHSPGAISQQQQQQSLFDNDGLSFDAFDQIEASPDPQSSMFTNMDQPPRFAQSQGFTTINNPAFTTGLQQNHQPTSYPRSNHVLHPEPGIFQNGHQQTSSLPSRPHRQTLTAEMPNIVSATQHITNYAAYNALGSNGGNAFGFHGMGVSDPSMNFSEQPMTQQITPRSMAGLQGGQARLAQPQQLRGDNRYMANSQGAYGYQI